MVARSYSPPAWQRSITLLTSTVVALVIVLAVQWGRPVLIPIAVAILLTFLLNPVVRALQRRGLRRGVSVMVSVLAAGIILICLVLVISRQVTNMLAEIPQNTERIKAKIKTLRELGSGPLADQFGKMVEEISEEFRPTSDGIHNARVGAPKPADTRTDPAAETLIVRREAIPWLTLTGYLGSALEVLATLAFSLVLLVFFLLGREDLRDRVVSLAGKTRLAFTSKALEDIANRVSRYIVMVAVVNGGFGILLAAGLFAFGVPYPLLWGFLAATLRFVPYIGSSMGAIFPIVMSLATSEGWWQPLAVLAFVMALELICGNVVEPYVFGHSIGVSPTALLISAAVWLYLWGPIGLVLSAPIAVCLVVLGKNIPQLGFLNLLLGDAPALGANLGIYQRLMLGDTHEASRLVIQCIKESSSDKAFDEMLISSLGFSKRDVQRDHLTDDDHQAVINSIRETLIETDRIRKPASILEQDPALATEQVQNSSSPATMKPTKILGCPVTDETDVLALEMLRQVLDPNRWEIEMIAVDTLTSELLARIVKDPPAVICISSLPPGGIVQARYLCRRLRDTAPEIQIIVGRWGKKKSSKIDRERLEQAGASAVVTSLLEAHEYLASLPPLVPSPILRNRSHFRIRSRGIEPGKKPFVENE